MKKILLILISIYSFSFGSYAWLSDSEFATKFSQYTCKNSVSSSSIAYNVSSNSTYYWDSSLKYFKIVTSTAGKIENNYNDGSTSQTIYYSCSSGGSGTQCASNYFEQDGVLFECSSGVIFPFIGTDDNATYALDPNGNLEKTCNASYSDLNGICTTVPDNGYFDEGGNLQCNSPYVNTDNSCTLPPNTNEDGSCMDGSYKDLLTNICKPIETTDNNDGSTTTNDSNGETTDYPTGTTVNYNPETGVTTTTYPDGTSTTTYPDGTSSTGGGTDGVSGGNTGGGTGGGSEDTSGENNSDNGSNDLPSDNVADNCNDANLSLQEKMLCELNEGMKKQNSESTPTDSLNNLMKDLRDNQMKDNTAMNQNLKDIESLNKEIKAINSSQLSTLNATKTATVAIASEVSKSNGFLESIGNGVTAITDFLTTITDLISDPSEIGTKLTDKLSEVANKFTQEFISVGTCPSIQTVSANYHGTTITFLSQDLINNYFPIDIMRTIIILTFAFSGAMTFFRGAN